MPSFPFIFGGPLTGVGINTLGGVRAAVRQRCDMVNSQFVTDAELNGYINASAQELWDVLAQKFGDDYFVADPYSFTTDGTNDKYALPADFLKLLAVDVLVNAGTTQYVNVPRFNTMDRNRFGPYGNVLPYGRINLYYKLLGSNIWLTPLPYAGQQIRLLYTPRFVLLVGDTDTLDGVDGWEEYVVVDVCIKALAKEESDASVFMQQKAALLERIEAASEHRDAANPQTTTITQGQNGVWPGFDPYGYGGGGRGGW